VNAQNTAAIAVVLLTTVLGAASATRERNLFDELYARGQEQNAGLKTLTASFVETSTSALLTRPLVARGTVIVERPARVALRYTDPDARVVLIDGDRMTMSWPSASIRSVKGIAASQRRIQKCFVDSSPDETAQSLPGPRAEADDRPVSFTMVPKRKQILEGMTRLDLWLDRSSLLLAAMRMTFPTRRNEADDVYRREAERGHRSRMVQDRRGEAVPLRAAQVTPTAPCDADPDAARERATSYSAT
jgi:outer membrane lipoprotein-sorting protein